MKKRRNVYQSVLILLFMFSMLGGLQAQKVGINCTPNSTFEVSGSIGEKVTTVTGNTTLDDTHRVVLCNNGASAISITLPAAAGITGRTYTIKRESSSTADVTIVGTIDGVANHKLIEGGESLTLISNGTEWKIVGVLEYFPMGEISYFSTTGANSGAFPGTSDGTTNMIKCAATTNLTSNMMFDNGGADNGRLRYTGDEMKHFHIACTISIAPTVNNPQLVLALAKNGTVIAASKVLQKMGTTTDIQSTALHVAVHMMKNDYLELYAGNMSGTGAIVVHSINLFAMGMSMK